MFQFIFGKGVPLKPIEGSSDEGKQRQRLSTWMAALETTALELIPLYNLFIPGSHDSGAYALHPDWGFSMDRADLRRSWLLNVFHFITYPLIARYSITQRLTVLEQLESGIRYLDIRVALRPEDGHFYICHNFYGPRLETILGQVARFARDHPREVIIIDFQHVHNFRADDDHGRLFELLLEHFGKKLVITGERPLSLASLWSTGEQVLVVYRHASQNTFSHLLWSADHLPNPWANTRCPNQLKYFLEAQITNRPGGKLFVTQGVLTPNTGYVVRNFFGTLESRLTGKANQLLMQLIAAEDLLKSALNLSDESEEADEAERDLLEEDQKDSKTIERTYGPNIIMFDFVEYNCFQLAHSIVGLNRRLLMSNKPSSAAKKALLDKFCTSENVILEPVA